MTTKTKVGIEDLEAGAQEIAQELETLEAQLSDARSQIARSEQKLAELEERRKELAPKTFAGDEKARVELDGLEDEHDEIARSTRVAQAAAPELEKMIEECKERLAHAQKQVHRARYEELLAQQHKLEEEAEEILSDYFAKQLELKAMRAHVVAEGRKGGLNLSPSVFNIAEDLFAKARAWEIRL